jgi:hypothetical protein
VTHILGVDTYVLTKSNMDRSRLLDWWKGTTMRKEVDQGYGVRFVQERNRRDGDKRTRDKINK